MKFIGIGLGPGEKELITLKAVECLNRVDVLLAAASEKTGQSHALDISEKHINPKAEIIKTHFPMTGDRGATLQAYQNYADLVAEKIKEGKSVGFACIGDPLLYGTYGNLIRILEEKYPEISVETIPGIPAFCAAAAAQNRVIAQDQEILTIVPVHKAVDLKKVVNSSDSLVLMKAYKEKNSMIDALREESFDREFLYTENCGLSNEFFSSDSKETCERTPNYLSLIFAKKQG